jgi:hypothetical protein
VTADLSTRLFKSRKSDLINRRERVERGQVVHGVLDRRQHEGYVCMKFGASIVRHESDKWAMSVRDANLLFVINRRHGQGFQQKRKKLGWTLLEGKSIVI